MGKPIHGRGTIGLRARRSASKFRALYYDYRTLDTCELDGAQRWRLTLRLAKRARRGRWVEIR